MNNYKINFNDTLQHHGVKGMKWGIRNEREPSGIGRGKYKRTKKSLNRVAIVGKKIARTALDIGTLGATKAIRKTRKEAEGQKNPYGKTTSGILRAINTGQWAFRNTVITSILGSSLRRINMSTNNPKIMNGTFAAAKALEIMGKVSTATIAAYHIKNQYNDFYKEDESLDKKKK